MKHKFKVVVDTIPLLSQRTGVGRYIYEVTQHLSQNDQYELDYYYGHYSKRLLSLSSFSSLRSLKWLVSKNVRLKRFARKLIMFSSRLWVPKYDLYWEPNFIPLQSIKSDKVITSIHDFSFLLYKEFHPKERIDYFEKYFFSNIYKSDMIICFSEFTKQEVLKRVDLPEEKIKVIYHGLDHDLFRVYTDCKTNLDLPEKFIFCVGSIEPRKNLLGLLQAFNSLDVTIKEEYHLVLAGFKGWKNEEIMNMIKVNQENIHYLGYISDQELAKVYNLATLFVYPSFYEGFGLPVLEAMACGTPVVTSHVSSIPEVGGDAVVYCDPHEPEDIRKKMLKVLSDHDLQQEKRTKGLNRAKTFTWERSAKEHLALFKKVLEH